MSYMLEFKTQGPLPAGSRSPPFVLFGINNTDHFHSLPPKIPLDLVLHLAPSLCQYVLPAPSLTPSGKYLALRTPYTGINILADIDIVGLKWIVNRMLQVGGLPILSTMVLANPNICTCIAIHKAWLALDLPVAGLQGLHLHMQCALSMGDAVTLEDMNAVWETFPMGSPLVKEMGLNFIRSHLDFCYTHTEFGQIRRWYLADRVRYEYFKNLDSKFLEFDDVQRFLERKITEREKK